MPLKLRHGTTLVVGEAAGDDEVKSGVGFSGGSGVWLQNMMKLAGQPWTGVSTVNCIGCKPPGNVFPGDPAWHATSKADAVSAVAYCREHHLWPAVRTAQAAGNAARIHAIGGKALEALTGKHGILTWRGSPLPLRGESRPTVIPTIHPAALMRQAKLTSVAVRDLRRPLTIAPEHYNLFPTLDDLRRFRSRTFAFDLEWNAQGDVTVCGLSDRFYAALVVPWVQPYLDELQRIFESADAIIGHNIVSADLPYIERLGWDLSHARIEDTMLKQHLVQPDYPHDLAFVASVFTHKVFWKGKGWEEEIEEGEGEFRGQQWRTWDRADALPRALGGYGGCLSYQEAFHLYNARDTDAEFQINTPLDAMLGKWELEKVYRHVSLPAGYICRWMSDRGLKLDVSRLGSIRAEIDTAVDALEAKLPEGLKPYEETVGCNLPAPAGTLRPKKKVCKGTRKVPHEPTEVIFLLPDAQACPVCQKQLTAGKMVEAKIVKGTRQERVAPYNSPPMIQAYVQSLRLGTVLDHKTGRVTTGKKARQIWAKNHPEFVTLGALKQQITLRNNFAKDSLQGQERMYFRLNVHGTAEGRLSAAGRRKGIDLNVQNCFSPDTEVLTPTGWVRFDVLPDICTVAQFNQHTRAISFVQPSRIVRRQHTGELLHIHSEENTDLLVTPEHECLYYNTKTDKPYKVPASAYPREAKQLHAGEFVGGDVTYTIPQLILLAALQADGCLGKRGRIDWSFAKSRKADRLRSALQQAHIGYRETKRKSGQYRFYVPRQDATEFLQDKKQFGPWVLGLERECFHVLAEEVWFWDGCASRRSHYSSSIKENAEWVQVLTALSGRRANLRAYHNGNPRSVVNWQVDATKRSYSCTSRVITDPIPWDGIVYCATVPDGNLLVRHNERISITGNCPEPFRVVFVPDQPDWGMVNIDISQGESWLTCWLAKDWARWEKLQDPHYDEHSEIAQAIFNTPVNKKLAKSDLAINALRQLGKKINHGRAYGMGAKKQLEDLQTAGYDQFTQSDVRDFIETWKRLNLRTAAWQAETMEMAARQGYLRNPFGRVRWFSHRDGTQALAFLPASSLADCVLRMMVCHYPNEFMDSIIANGTDVFHPLVPDWLMSIQVHDSLVFQGPWEGRAEQTARSSAIMTQPFKELDGFAFRVDVKESRESWGECS